jgi:hypothetical protein
MKWSITAGLFLLIVGLWLVTAGLAHADGEGVYVNPTSGLNTSEVGGTATFNISLNTSPSADVSISLSSSDLTEGTVLPASVIFTNASGNWSTPQTVTVKGVDDYVMDGNITYTIITTLTSTGNYSGINPADISVNNSDDDVAGIIVTPTSGLVTTEDGGTAPFNIRLNSSPSASANVIINLTSNDSTEGTVSPSSVTFTTSNWNVPQPVTVTGVDDLVMDGNIAYTIITAAAISTDPNYSGRDAADVSVTNTDNDVAGITVHPTSGLFTLESGSTASFTIKLNTQPTHNVFIPLVSLDTGEGTISLSSVTFTIANWNIPQIVTVTGVDDLVVDGDITYTIDITAASSDDPNYSGEDANNVSVTNNDNDSPGITVNPTLGLITTEAGGTATFTIRLNTAPNASVVIGISSNDFTEGTVSPPGVTFTAFNWNMPQTVTVTGVNDADVDGDITYTIGTAAAVSSDGNYSGRNAVDVSVTNIDNDTPGITVTPTSGLVTTEAGGTATFNISLNTLPLANVSIGLSSSNTSEGTVSPASVTFGTSNWSTPQTVTVTGVDDAVRDGNIAYTIVTAAATSTDLNYNGRNAADVSVTNTDNDTPGIAVTPTSGLVTTEAGGTATFNISLNALPTDNVNIGLSSSDTGEGTVSPSSVTFSTSNWSTPRTVTVTGVNDAAVDGNIPYSIVTAAAISTDSGYNGLDAADVSVTNNDNDTATATCQIGKPQPTSPGNNSINQSVSITLSWNASANASLYIVYLGTSTLTYRGNTSNTSYVVSNLSYSTKYHWQVVANNSCGLNNSSAVWNFTTTCATAPTKPQTPSPVNGSVNISTSVTLNWSVCANATSYDVYWNTSPTLTYRGNTTNSSYPASLNYSTQYYWKVVANNSCGINSSDVWNFTTASASVSTPTPTPTPTPIPINFDIGGTKASWNTSSTGVIPQAVNVVSADGEINIHIPAGTTALNDEGEPLDELNMSSTAAYPAASGDRAVIAAFNFDPDGATFNPGIQITLTYDPDTIPAGVNESSLIIAFYNESSEGWEYITGVVNTGANTITFTVRHFTTFTIQTPPVKHAGGGVAAWVIIVIVFFFAIVLGVIAGLYLKHRRIYGSLYYEDEGAADDQYDKDSEDRENEEDFKF